jgi:UTP pyrophosphatase
MSAVSAAASTPQLKYLSAYPAPLQAQVQHMIDEQRLGDFLQKRHPDAHTVRTDGALRDYVGELKAQFMRQSAPIAKVCYDSTLQVVKHALGTHTTVQRVQGSKLKTKHEIRIASVFKTAPANYLKMIVVHELAHLKEPNHDKAFYQLCCHMAPDYHQLEFDLRVYLTWLDLGKAGNLS